VLSFGTTLLSKIGNGGFWKRLFGGFQTHSPKNFSNASKSLPSVQENELRPTIRAKVSPEEWELLTNASLNSVSLKSSVSHFDASKFRCSILLSVRVSRKDFGVVSKICWLPGNRLGIHEERSSSSERGYDSTTERSERRPLFWRSARAPGLSEATNPDPGAWSGDILRPLSNFQTTTHPRELRLFESNSV
jgi:hypothetical protein